MLELAAHQGSRMATRMGMMMVMRSRRIPVAGMIIRRRMAVIVPATMFELIRRMPVTQRKDTTAKPGDDAEHQQP